MHIIAQLYVHFGYIRYELVKMDGNEGELMWDFCPRMVTNENNVCVMRCMGIWPKVTILNI
jgi:hypothetical protein